MITYYQANLLLNHIFGRSPSYTAPVTYYVGLSTTPINADGTGATEPSGGAYARVAVTNNKTNWGVAANGALSNLTNVEFPESTLEWGIVTHIFVSDASTSGNVLYYDTLTPARTVQSAATILFDAGSITMRMTNPA
jgi:hypothetical protein